MPKTVTLRLNDDVYELLSKTAKAENRSLSNLIETYTLERIREMEFVDDVEMAEILSNRDLIHRIQEGSRHAKQRKGRFVQ